MIASNTCFEINSDIRFEIISDDTRTTQAEGGHSGAGGNAMRSRMKFLAPLSNNALSLL